MTADVLKYYNLGFCLLSSLAAVYAQLWFVHMLQLGNYQGGRYLRWLDKHGKTDFLPFILIGVIVVTLKVLSLFMGSVLPVISEIVYYGTDAIYIVSLILMKRSFYRTRPRKGLNYTGRVIRLLVTLYALAFASAYILLVHSTRLGGVTFGVVLMRILVSCGPGILAPLYVLLGFALTYPLETAIRRWYFNDAQKRLAARDIIKIAITGSYGKTSTKYALASMLSEKYKVLFTPGSYNTPMGVSRVIRGELRDEHEVFIAEMGARRSGDVAELCQLVRPRYGLITALGKQHLSTFKSFDKIVATKAELISALPEDGCFVTNGDNPACRELFEACGLENKYLFGLEHAEHTLVRVENLIINDLGSAFDLVAGEQKIACGTRLLGTHNVMNILAAATVALKLGLTLDEIARGIEKLEPVEHRLQLIDGSVTVIDDSFNSNPEGAREALSILKGFKGRRIIVTPGMMELGDEEAECNRELGRLMADCADVAILVGKAHVEPIREGLLEKGFDQDRILRVDSQAEATEALPRFTSHSTIVLYENDLPDNYNE